MARAPPALAAAALALILLLGPPAAAQDPSASAPSAPPSDAATRVLPPPSGPPAAYNTTFSAPPGPPEGWIRARSSWYGTPKPFVDTFAPSRGGGESAFGILEWGGCGYTNADGSLPFDKGEVSSYSDNDPDFPGSCGRCYEVRCVDGVVLGYQDKAVQYDNFYYYPEHGSAVDTYGREFPGNPAEKDGYIYVKCWDPKASIRVHVIDICPCWYSPKGQEPYEQPSCCYKNSTNPRSGQHELDMSFWAYEKLAHPMYPEMMLDIRPVACDSGAALQYLPGYIERNTLYGDMVGTGWSWFPYETPTQNFNVTAAGWGLSGTTAACAEIAPSGGMTWWCRSCYKEGYQPFWDASAVTFWIRNRFQPGTTLPLKVVVAQQEDDTYCPGEAYLTAMSPSATGGDGWQQFTIPFEQWNCGDTKSTRDKISFQNVGSGNTWFCIDDLKVEHNAPPPAAETASATKK
ncbi:hypothetical protein HYH03_013034 [Edaphochlamys debaryana]|uniref:Expansin-like EG45 domain-containing protein n=1 Tax=Edaphochlamys debaryana TaxID=47281 RepID=A0A835XZ81_9CHLO|nr:hypothetical protein HYH03_013034 [Edaphochlamys debaryana]|eukprot:KAG2488344.1 hypothetical protein HYH03_013034 [Edaphochlamys debaryana]